MSKTLKQSLRRELIAGCVALIVGVVGIAGWIYKAEISQAALASGLLEPSQGSLMVQHPRGGVVSQVWVKAGAKVSKGDKLVSFVSDEMEVELSRLENRLIQARAKQHRLMVEFEGLEWSTPLDLKHSKGITALAVQRQIYNARQNAYDVQKDILQSKLIELDEEREGLARELESFGKQRNIVSERVRALEELTRKKMISQTDQLNLIGKEADLVGRIGSMRADLARTDQRKAEAKLRLEMLARDRIESLSQELSEQQLAVEELFDLIKITQVRLRETELYAEHDGLVTELTVGGRGEVVAAGQAIMRLVPDEDELIVVGRIKPDDIDLVRPGSHVDIVFSAYSLRGQVPVKGTLRVVSADLVQTDDGLGYYEVEIDMEPDAVKASGLALYPGMRTELSIKGETLPVWRYLFAPVLNSLGRAFHEA